MNWTFPAGRLFGIAIRIHWSLPLVAVFRVLDGALLGGGSPILIAWFAALMAGLTLTVLLHELSHCWAARAVGGHAHEILLTALGGLSYVGHGGAARDDIKIAAAGPAVHLPIVGLLAGFLAVRGLWSWSYLNLFASWFPIPGLQEHFWDNLCVGLIKLQIILFAFNLLVPAFPLDGGRILVNFLMIRHGRDRAAAISTYFSVPIAIAIIVWSFLARDVFMAVIGGWILFEAWRIRKMISMGALDAHPMFAGTPQYDYMPDRERPRRKGWLARWRDRRAEAASRKAADSDRALRDRVDIVLEKVSRDGMSSLSAEERRILDEASRRSRRD